MRNRKREGGKWRKVVEGRKEGRNIEGRKGESLLE
jgi:hypothetical protein